jgi:4-hydroxy-tetrahydrodipicolinate synthase
MQLTGIVPAVGTPLLGDESVDAAGLTRLIEYLVAAKVNGILANGSMGGFAFLTDDEQIRSIAVSVAAVNGRVPVIGGLGETGTRRAVAKARAIAREGVDAISILPPFYFLAEQRHLLEWFGEIAASVDLPVFLYDNPALTKNPLQIATVCELVSRVPNVAGIKVSNQDMVNLQALMSALEGGRRISVLTGSEHLALAGLQIGCDGCVGGSYNISPHIAVGLYTAFLKGDLARAKKLQQDLIAVWSIFLRGAVWGGFDEALRYLGIAETATAMPYRTALSGAERDEVRRILDQYVKPYVATAAALAE